MATDLKSINIKRNLNTFIKVLMDMKVLGLLALMGFTFYGIGYDTVYRPNMEELKKRDEAIQIQKQELNQRKGLQGQYKVWEQELKGLESHMVPIPPGDSIQVISVTQTTKLMNLARGKERDEQLTPPLQPPHDKREDVTLTPGQTTIIDLLNPTAAPGAAPAATSAPAEVPGEGAATAAPTSVPVRRFDFEIRLKGTYPALVDFVNQLVTQSSVVQINKVTLTKVAGATADEPDPKEFPDYPVKVEMVLSLSMLLYDAPAP